MPEEAELLDVDRRELLDRRLEEGHAIPLGGLADRLGQVRPGREDLRPPQRQRLGIGTREMDREELLGLPVASRPRRRGSARGRRWAATTRQARQDHRPEAPPARRHSHFR
ncbi:MAG: hypothetical protein H6735_03940 [Alphaproteobacteria bacterium]|nr:hypothetical protein [Alphaproteobacteria bacterium]